MKTIGWCCVIFLFPLGFWFGRATALKCEIVSLATDNTGACGGGRVACKWMLRTSDYNDAVQIDAPCGLMLTSARAK